ncbi:MAG: NAD(P)/FAD-dependent oxidoreductase [Eubacterium sp.]|nr:NAD(P)/FAD-dependent oxidoreductase [Eubacterium sp.]
MKKVIVVGGGPAGVMAAIQAAKAGHEVTLIEQNEKLGKKLFLTGKGRCNITNGCDVSELFDSVVSNPKFLYSAFYSFSNEDVISFFEKHGLPTKEERGKRIFPQSDKSSDVIRVLSNQCEELGVKVLLRTKVIELLVKDDEAYGVKVHTGQKMSGDKIIFATGGVSYPSTGSDGSGIRMLEKNGHTIRELRPGLVGMLVRETYPREMQGLTLKNVQVSIGKKDGKKVLYQNFGELLFTHYGVSGPMVLSASSLVGDKLSQGDLSLDVDLKPALSKEQLEKRIVKDFQERPNVNLQNVLGKLLPKSMIPVMLSYVNLDGGKKVNEVTREERRLLLKGMKEFSLTLCWLRKIDEAIVTRGGIHVGEVDPSTMESKRIKNLYIAGEMLDLDALTGGYNLQIAWSTGFLAGND